MGNERIILLIVGLAVGLVTGVFLGMTLQQMIIGALAVQVAEGLEGTNIEVNVDMNETQLIEGYKSILIPILNQTMQKGEKIK